MTKPACGCRIESIDSLIDSPTIDDEKIVYCPLHESAGELLEALQGIKARINGEYDHPALTKIGPLSSTWGDINTIITNAIANATRKG